MNKRQIIMAAIEGLIARREQLNNDIAVLQSMLSGEIGFSGTEWLEELTPKKKKLGRPKGSKNKTRK